MRKQTLILLALLALTLTGCEEIHQPVLDIKKERATHITEFSYRGHKYILYERRYLGRPYGSSGITHDPDCPCREKGGVE